MTAVATYLYRGKAVAMHRFGPDAPFRIAPKDDMFLRVDNWILAALSNVQLPDLRDVFLCHAWDDRQGDAKTLHDMLEARGVSVWFSEKDVALGTSLLREIDKGLVRSRVGLCWSHQHCCAVFQQLALLTKSFQHSLRPKSSCRSSITQRTRLFET